MSTAVQKRSASKSHTPDVPDLNETLSGSAGTDYEIDKFKAISNAGKRVESFLESQDDQSTEKKELYGHQKKVFKKLLNFLKEGLEKVKESGPLLGWIKLPCGSGKTAIFSSLANVTELRTLVLVPTTNLIHQTVTELKEFSPKNLKMGEEEVNVSTYGDGSHDLSGKVVVSTYQSLKNVIEAAKQQGIEFELVIADEAHMSLTDIRQTGLEEVPGCKIRIGLTATPDYNDDQKILDKIGKKVSSFFGTCIAKMSLYEAVRDGICCGIRNIILKTSCDLSNVPIQGKEFSQKELKKAVNIEERHQAVLKILKNKEYAGKSAAVFDFGVEEAQDMAKLLNDHDISAAAVWGGMDDELGKGTCDQILEAHRRGEIKVICSKDKLIMGWDSPRTELCFNLQPTRSPPRAEQRDGRPARNFVEKDKSWRKLFCTIFDFVDEGKIGITATQILGSSLVLPKGDRQSGAIPYGNSSPSSHPDLNLDGIEVYMDELEINEVIRKALVKEALTTRAGINELRQFFLHSACLNPEEALKKPLNFKLGDMGQQATAKETLKIFCEENGLKYDDDPRELLKRVSEKIFPETREVEKNTFLTLLDESQKVSHWANILAQNGESFSELSSIIIRRLKDIKLKYPPTPEEFGEMLFRPKGVPHNVVHGRTILGYLGITTTKEYLKFLRPSLPDRLQKPRTFKAIRERQTNLTSPANVLIAAASDEKSARKFLASTNFCSPQMTMGKPVDLEHSPDTHFFVTAREYLEGMRLKLETDLQAALSNQMISHLGRYAYGGHVQGQRFADKWEQRCKVVELADRNKLERLILGIPNIELMTREEFAETKLQTRSGLEISGEIIIQYYQREDLLEDSFDALQRKIVGPRRLPKIRRVAVEEALELAKKMDAGSFSVQTFAEHRFELTYDRSIMGSLVLESLGYPTDDPDSFLTFLTKELDFTPEKATFWLSDRSRLREIIQQTRQAALAAGVQKFFGFGLHGPYDKSYEKITVGDLIHLWDCARVNPDRLSGFELPTTTPEMSVYNEFLDFLNSDEKD